MEQYKLLSLGDRNVINIGDYVQALASSQFYPHIDGYILREKLKDYDGPECNVIMNGWYMHDPTQWPPSPKINPLFVALHLNNSVSDKLLSSEGIEYLKKYQPIGCRDTYTRDILIEKEIDAYFSVCMTLTLGKNYKSEQKDNTVYFVDPTHETPKSIKSISLSLIVLLCQFKSVSILIIKKGSPKNLKYFLREANFLRLYNQVFTKDTILKVQYISQQSSHYANDFSDDDARLKEAERLIKLYSRAGLVVTSRIHCALPCLGLETPVIYTTKKINASVSSCRLGGILDLFNVIRCDSDSIFRDFKFTGKVSLKNIPENKTLWNKFACRLIKTCEEFISRNKGC